MSAHSLRRALVLAVSVLMTAATFVSPSGARAPSVAVVTPAPTPTPSPTPVPVPQLRPTIIEIPSLGVRAPVIGVGLDADGAMGTPKTANEIAWWDGLPVGAGNALMAGHRNWNGRVGSFGRIAELKPGDMVNVYGDGYQLGFRVEWTRQMGGNDDAADVLADTGAPMLTMITCGGEFDARIRHYLDRIVVRAVLA